MIMHLGTREFPVDLGPFEMSKSDPGIRKYSWLDPEDASTVHSIER